MKKKFWMILALSLVGVLLFSLGAWYLFFREDSRYTQTQAYTYPVLAGSDQWNQMTMEERYESCYVERSVVEEMTTKAVLQTVLDYPFIVNTMSYFPFSKGVNVVKENCPPLVELLEREDAEDALKSYLNTCKLNGNTEQTGYIIAQRLLEYVQ